MIRIILFYGVTEQTWMSNINFHIIHFVLHVSSDLRKAQTDSVDLLPDNPGSDVVIIVEYAA